VYENTMFSQSPDFLHQKSGSFPPNGGGCFRSFEAFQKNGIRHLVSFRIRPHSLTSFLTLGSLNLPTNLMPSIRCPHFGHVSFGNPSHQSFRTVPSERDSTFRTTSCNHRRGGGNHVDKTGVRISSVEPPERDEVVPLHSLQEAVHALIRRPLVRSVVVDELR